MGRLALIFAIVFLMVFQAHADPRWQGRAWDGHWGHASGGHWGRGYGRPGGYGDPMGGFLGGVVGGIFGNWLSRPEPQVVIVPPQRDEAWCIQRYRSYDPYTHTYLGFDGLRHGCP